MTFSRPEALEDWAGQTALVVRVSARLGPQSEPIEDATVWHLSPTDSPRPPMLGLAVGSVLDKPLLEDRAVTEQDGQYLVSLVRLSFGDADRQLAVELMPNAVRRALQLEVWTAAEDEPGAWDHHTFWDVAPMLMRWRPDAASGTNCWEFVGKVRRPVRAPNRFMAQAEDAYGQLPVFATLRGYGPLPEQRLTQPPWPSFVARPGLDPVARPGLPE